MGRLDQKEKGNGRNIQYMPNLTQFVYKATVCIDLVPDQFRACPALIVFLTGLLGGSASKPIKPFEADSFSGLALVLVSFIHTFDHMFTISAGQTNTNIHEKIQLASPLFDSGCLLYNCSKFCLGKPCRIACS